MFYRQLQYNLAALQSPFSSSVSICSPSFITAHINSLLFRRVPVQCRHVTRNYFWSMRAHICSDGLTGSHHLVPQLSYSVQCPVVFDSDEATCNHWKCRLLLFMPHLKTLFSKSMFRLSTVLN